MNRANLCVAILAGIVVLTGCDPEGANEKDKAPSVQQTAQSIKNSTDKLADETRAAVEAATENAEEISARAAAALDKAGTTIAERSQETIAKAKEKSFEAGEKGAVMVEDVVAKTRSAYEQIEVRSADLIEGKEPSRQ